MKELLLAALFVLSFSETNSQGNILDNQDIQETIENCLYNTYGFNFEDAHKLQKELETKLPGHPASPFLNALIIYWEYFPLLPDDPETSNFISLMDHSIELSEILQEKDPGSLEGIFFDLHARAFKAMFWADNGKPGKVLKDLDDMYRQTLEGIRLKGEFDEFYFCSGLYHYYIEAYVEEHPVYKPIISLFREGNREMGLEELEYAADHTTYIRYESMLFLSLLYLNYEHDYEKALDYAAALYNNFPDNIYYTGQYLIILLYSSNFTVASVLGDQIRFDESEFHRLIYFMNKGFLYENQLKDYNTAKSFYMRTITKASMFGEIANIYASIAHAGLARIALLENDPSEARRNLRKSRQLSGFDFIRGYEASDPR